MTTGTTTLHLSLATKVNKTYQKPAGSSAGFCCCMVETKRNLLRPIQLQMEAAYAIFASHT